MVLMRKDGMNAAPRAAPVFMWLGPLAGFLEFGAEDVPRRAIPTYLQGFRIQGQGTCAIRTDLSEAQDRTLAGGVSFPARGRWRGYRQVPCGPG